MGANLPGMSGANPGGETEGHYGSRIKTQTPSWFFSWREGGNLADRELPWIWISAWGRWKEGVLGLKVEEGEPLAGIPRGISFCFVLFFKTVSCAPQAGPELLILLLLLPRRLRFRDVPPMLGLWFCGLF